MYSTAAFAFLGKIIPFFDRSAIERLVVMCGKKSLIQVFFKRIRIHIPDDKLLVHLLWVH